MGVQRLKRLDRCWSDICNQSRLDLGLRRFERSNDRVCITADKLGSVKMRDFINHFLFPFRQTSNWIKWTQKKYARLFRVTLRVNSEAVMSCEVAVATRCRGGDVVTMVAVVVTGSRS